MPTSVMLWTSVLVIVVAAGVAAAIFRRQRAPGPQPAPSPAPAPGDVSAQIDAFWAWWRDAAGRLAAAIDAGRAQTIVEEVGARVQAIHPGLAWETGPGVAGARHHLALSSEGDAELRVVAERWRAGAPAPDDAWEHYAARQAHPRPGVWSLKLTIQEGTEIDFALVRVGIDEDPLRERVRVRFFHPAFASLDDRARATAAFLTLDSVLGEDAVEKWLGALDPLAAPPDDGRPLAALAEAVEELRETATGERFARIRGEDAGRPLVARVNLALKRIDHLMMDGHLTVTIPLQEPTPEGLARTEEDEALDALEDELAALLGHDAVYIGHETADGQRVLHFHVATLGPAGGRARAWASGHADRCATVSLTHDPAWDVLRRW